MKTLKIGEKEYVLEFTFEAAEHKGLVQSMFNIVSGTYMIKHQDENNVLNTMFNSISEMVGDIPGICRTAFYAGLLEHNEVLEKEAKELMKQYMKDNKLSYNKLFEELKTCMEDDGFFDLSGLTEVVKSIEKNVKDAMKEQENTETKEETTEPQE